ncbi:sensor histidine kinase [Pseudoponticoccus marisrubri]|uniref:histidine kinase n=1 Tax=Pseudoponticoccus marisrubri TaxID=1685382 RepID=A0A0W7WM22_9RHOB|nr:HAMP domain-containing sensor histidine kinase [Pseudoponticoccus marisrubri]KUF11637.1 hypothetical protein AVJ23_07755 [Pseudoponticoccus marisrubri]
MHDLHALGLLDGRPDAAFDSLTRLAATQCAAPGALVSFHDAATARHVIKSLYAPERSAAGALASYTDARLWPRLARQDGLVAIVEEVSPADGLAALGAVTCLGGAVELPDGTPIGSFCVWHDAPRRWTETERDLIRALARCASEILRRMLAEQDSADLRAAQARSRAELHRFAHAAAHDLRSPLRAIANAAVWLSEDLEPVLCDETRAHIDQMLSRTARLHRLVDDLLACCCLDTGAEAPGRITGQEMLAALRAQTGPRPGLSLHADAAFKAAALPSGPLTEVLRRLVDNALTFHDRDVGTVGLALDDRGEAWQITVRDDGPGIAPRHQTRVFDPFARLFSQDAVPGSGLGLTMVERQVRLTGGQVWLHSEGRGTAVHVTWPKPANMRQAKADRPSSTAHAQG